MCDTDMDRQNEKKSVARDPQVNISGLEINVSAPQVSLPRNQRQFPISRKPQTLTDFLIE